MKKTFREIKLLVLNILIPITTFILKYWKIFSAIGIIIGGLIYFGSLKSDVIDPVTEYFIDYKINQLTGDLEGTLNLPKYTDSLIIVAGGTDTLFRNNEICKEYKLRSSSQKCFLRIFINEDNRIGIDAKIFSSEGDFVSSITNNFVKVFKKSEFNYGDTGFELLDSKNNVCFNLIYIENKNLLGINGIFDDEKGYTKLYKSNVFGSANPFGKSKMSMFNPDIDLMYDYSTNEKGILDKCSGCRAFPFIRPTNLEKEWIKKQFGETPEGMNAYYFEYPIIVETDTIKGNSLLIISDSLEYSHSQTESLIEKLKTSFGNINLNIGLINHSHLIDIPTDYNKYVPIKGHSLEAICNRYGLNKNIFYVSKSNVGNPNLLICDCSKKFLIKTVDVLSKSFLDSGASLNDNDLGTLTKLSNTYKIAKDTSRIPYNNIRLRMIAF